MRIRREKRLCWEGVYGVAAAAALGKRALLLHHFEKLSVAGVKVAGAGVRQHTRRTGAGGGEGGGAATLYPESQHSAI
jgi:hypothetical protein